MANKRRLGRPTTHKIISGSAPIGGLNVRDAINSMPPNDALTLVNWIPQQYGVRSRKGYSEWAINLGGPVRTIMAYQPDRTAIANYKLFAATDASVFDVTNSTSAPVESLALPATENYGRLTFEMMSNSAGTFLVTCSNQGGYRFFDGVTWGVPVSGVSPGQVDGVNPANLSFVTSWKRRLWFIEKGTCKVWYADTDALTGTFHPLDVGPFMKHGGVLSFIARWTIDAGEGIDDFLVIGGENGDILIYKGTDPSSITTFGLQGVWYVGRLPLGQRCFHTLGGDLLVLSEAGLQPLSYVTRGGASQLRTSTIDYLAKIQPRLAELVSTLADQIGWELNLILRENLLIIQKPTGGTVVYDQYVLYTNTNKWCVFNGLPMICGHSAQSGYYFGTEDGRVCLGLNGYFDGVPYGSTVGNGITGVIQPSFSYFGLPGQNKQWHMIRPTFLATDRPAVTVGMIPDYRTDIQVGSPTYSPPAGSLWDVALWDSSVWGGSLNTYQDWYSVDALGYTGSAYLVTNCVGDTFLASIDYMVEPGGAL